MLTAAKLSVCVSVIGYRLDIVDGLATSESTAIRGRTWLPIPCLCCVVALAVATAISHIYPWTGLIELGRSVTGIDTPYPTVIGPIDGTIEIVRGNIGIILPG